MILEVITSSLALTWKLVINLTISYKNSVRIGCISTFSHSKI